VKRFSWDKYPDNLLYLQVRLVILSFIVICEENNKTGEKQFLSSLLAIDRKFVKSCEQSLRTLLDRNILERVYKEYLRMLLCTLFFFVGYGMR
jgi:hypothetical protein